MPAGNRIRRWRLAESRSSRRPFRSASFLVGRDSVEPVVEKPIADSTESRPTGWLIAPGLGACGAGFFDQLPFCFDPVVGGVACQGKLDPSLCDKIGAKPDLFIGGLRDRSRLPGLFGGGGLARTNGFLLRGRLFFPGRCGRADCFRFGPSAAGACFRLLTVRLFICVDFRFSSHVLRPPLECPIYRRGQGCKRIL
jgi:hypothetical protein